MDWSFGKVFTQAMNNAMQAEAEKKKQIMDYNLNVDNLNLNKWQAYNQLNLENAKFNEANNQWGLKMGVDIDQNNWDRMFKTKEFNTNLGLKKATEFFMPDEQFRANYLNAYGIPYMGMEAPGADGLHSFNSFNTISGPLGKIAFEKSENQKNRDNEVYIQNLQSATQTAIAKMNIQADLDMANLRNENDKLEYQRNLDNNATQRLMIKLDAKGSVIDTRYPTSFEDMKALSAQKYIFHTDWGGSLSGTLENMPKPQQKTSYPGIHSKNSQAEAQGYYK